ncbi:hypothetical protein RJ640_003509 [Escallonia rubra]|uniref:Chromo domain-containing protein n=1 Tax=Escallonia rubra TaxID=112253 RepID=A0AA88QVL5_9ASTE|nr:hypothetical protein RJ640_003509 [Escallonia rubra]
MDAEAGFDAGEDMDAEAGKDMEAADMPGETDRETIVDAGAVDTEVVAEVEEAVVEAVDEVEQMNAETASAVGSMDRGAVEEVGAAEKAAAYLVEPIGHSSPSPVPVEAVESPFGGQMGGSSLFDGSDNVRNAETPQHNQECTRLLRFVGGLFLQESSRVPHTVSFVPSKATVCQVVSEPRLSQKTVASAKRIVWDSLLRKTMANTKERIDALEAQVQRIVQCDEDAPGILKQISIRLDALEVNVEATDNARYAETMDWEGKSNGGKKPGGQAPNQSWGSKSSWASNSSTLQKSGVGFKAKPDASTSGEVKKPAFRGCFLCQGPHVIANCPQRQMMNAFFDNMGQVQRGEQSGSQSRHPPTEEQTDTQDYEEEDAVGAFPQWCNAVTTQVGNPEESSTGEKPKDMPPKKKSDVPGKGLMYVDIKVNGKAIRTMVDTGATHNYISSTEVERLGLTLEKGCGRVKAINSAAQPVAGIARSVLIKIGPYEGRTNFSVVIMDDFKLILGLEFLRDTKTTVMPCTNSLAMLGSKPCVIPTVSTRAGERSISALQLKKGLKRDETTYLAMLRADSRVAINIGQKIKKALTRDPVAQQLLKLIESVNVPKAGKSPRAISFSEEWRQNIDLAHSYLEKAARRMKKHADKNRRSQEFNVGEKVMVKLLPQDRKFLRGRDSRLLQKYEGPLTIVKKIGKMAYKVDPPNWWSRQLHPVFHVSMLKPFYEDTADPSRGQIKRPGLKPKAAGKRVAEAILNDRVITASRKRHQEYLVKWQGYMDEENTWERAADLSAYTDKIEAYHMQKLTRASTALVGENVTGCPLHPPSTAPPRPRAHVAQRPRAHPAQRPLAHPARAHASLQVLQVSRPCARQAQRPCAQL